MSNAKSSHYLVFPLCLCASVVQFLSSPRAAAQDTAGKLLRTDSRAGYTHRLTLYDRAGQAINPEEKNARPYSPKITCGKCHEYGLINHGWHFNAGLSEEPQAAQPQPAASAPGATGGSSTSAGRPGEPWIYTDPDTGTQLPLSYRDWPGTFRPADVGITPWKFVQLFGRHLPGGGIFDPDPNAPADPNHPADPHEAARWKISGGLEIDCMVCHAGSGSGYDAGEIARQVARENLAWIPTATLGLGVVRGDAKKLPDDFDPEFASDNPDRRPPEVAYNKALFDADQRVYFDIVKDPPAERCYFCHSVREVTVGKIEPWNALRQPWEKNADVHLAAGLRCSDCHNNGIDHRTNRGDHEEVPPRSLSSCIGCHFDDRFAMDILRQRANEWSRQFHGTPFAGTLALANRDATVEETLAGPFRAPQPQHVGIPPLHFAKLTCTACHSSTWPTAGLTRIQTSFAHTLGDSTKERREEDAPAIFEPVFKADAASVHGWKEKIGPDRLVWPAYWAKSVDNKLTPLPIDAVQKAAKKNAQRAKKKAETRGALTDDEITLLLKSLTKAAPAGGRESATGSASTKSTPSTKSTIESSKDQIGYLRDGNFYTLAEGDKLKRETLAYERPYLWPLAHDVRPARQALGVRGCTDCHAADAPMFFGSLAATAQIPGTPLPVASMDQLIGYDKSLATAWADSFAWRTAFKWASFICLGIATLALLRRSVLMVLPAAPLPQTPTTSRPRITIWDVLLRFLFIVFTISLLAEFFSHWGVSPISGRALRIHMLAAAPFVLSFAGLACFSAASARRFNPQSALGARVANWIITFTLICGILSTGAILLAMLPVFGTDSQRTLIDLHGRFSYTILTAFLFSVVIPALIRMANNRMEKKH